MILLLLIVPLLIIGCVNLKAYSDSYTCDYYISSDGTYEKPMNRIIGWGFILLAVFVFFLFCWNSGQYDQAEYEKVAEWNIVSSGDSTNTSGHFFLGSGSIDEEAIYSYYYPVGPDSYQQGWIKEENATIIEDVDIANAHIEKWESRSQMHKWAFQGGGPTIYEVHVPKGAVIQQHVYDLEK